jgi:hypothetical protein
MIRVTTKIAALCGVALSGLLMAASGFGANPPVLVGNAIAQSGWMQPYDYGVRMANFAIDDINAKTRRSRREPGRVSSSRAPTSSS